MGAHNAPGVGPEDPARDADTARLSIPVVVVEDMIGVAQNAIQHGGCWDALRIIERTLVAEYKGTKGRLIDGSEGGSDV